MNKLKGQYSTINIAAISNTLTNYTSIHVFGRSVCWIRKKLEADACVVKKLCCNFGALTGVLKTLKTTRFTAGFQIFNHTQWFGFSNTVQILCIGTDRSQQTVQTKIRLPLKKQSDQGLRCLPFHQHLLDALMQCYIKLFYF